MSDYELRYLEGSTRVLEQYLLSDSLYWMPGFTALAGEPPFPSITPGNILLALMKAGSLSTAGDERSRFLKIERELEAIRSQWRSAWVAKCGQEFQSRLNLWGSYLEEYIREPEKQYDRYGFEVTRRVILELLLAEKLNLAGAETESLTNLDSRLRYFFQPGKFIWSDDLSSAFPESLFWYLYGTVVRA